MLDTDFQSLQQRFQDLERQEKYWEATIGTLEKARVTEDVLGRIKLEPELKRAKAELAKIDQQKVKLQKEKVCSSFMFLDYFNHVLFIQAVCSKHHVVAFMIHGPWEPGQEYQRYSVRSLLKRLVKTIPYNEMTLPIEFPLYRRSKNDIESLWRQLGSALYLGAVSPETVAEGISKQLETQNVILVFHDIDFMGKDYVRQLINEFWQPLVRGVSISSSKSDFLLLMFLVDYGSYEDYSDCVKKWRSDLVEELDQDWKPHIPISLPIVNKFSYHDLNFWIQNYFIMLPYELRKSIGGPEGVDHMLQKILEESNNGVPDLVMAHICLLCGLYLEGPDEWLRL